MPRRKPAAPPTFSRRNDMNWKSPILAPLVAFALAAGVGWLSSAAASRSANGESGELAVRSHDRAPLSTVERQAATLRTLERELRFGPPPPQKYFDAKGMEKSIAASIPARGGFPVFGSSTTYGYDWARAAPEAMFAWLSAEGSSGGALHSSILFDSWAEKDLSAAYAAAKTLTEPELRQEAVLAVVEKLLQSDPERARTVFVENFDAFMPEGKEPWSTGQGFYPQVLEMLQGMPPSTTRIRFIAHILNGFASDYSDPTARARSVWDQAPSNFREELVAAGFTSSAQRAASFAGLEEITRQHVESVGTPRDIAAFLETHGPAWARRDLDAALAWTAANLKGRDRFDQSAELFFAVAVDDYPAALEAWRSLPEGYLKHAAAREIARTVPPEQNDPELLRERDR